MNFSLSIIVPVYNAGKYLSQCLDSLLAAEDIEKTEIILVDDGSSDESGQIADEYAGRYENIRSFHQENGGASAARNAGLAAATGTYVSFCDSDDMILPELFSEVIKLTETSSAEMIMWDSDIVYESKNLLSRKNNKYFSHCGLERIQKTYSGKQIVEILVTKGKGVIASVCLGAYRRDYLISNEFFFEEGTIYEDELWVPRVIINAQQVIYIPQKIYLYRIHTGSVSHPASEDTIRNIEALLHVYPALYRYYDDVLMDDPLRIAVEGNVTKRYLHMIYKYRFWRFGYGKEIDKHLLWKTATKLRHKAMVLFLYLVTG